MENNVFTIWSNKALDYDTKLLALRKSHSTLSDAELYRLIEAEQNEKLCYVRCLLNVILPQTILRIVYKTEWDDQTSISAQDIGNNLRSCLYPTSDSELESWYIDRRGDLCGSSGNSNACVTVYRCWKPNISETRKRRFLARLVKGQINRKGLTRVTKRLGDEVASIYSFRIPGVSKKK